MSGFLGVLDPPVPTAHLEKLVGGVDPQADGSTARWDAQAGPAPYASSGMSARVASVVLKVEALTELLQATAKNRGGDAKKN